MAALFGLFGGSGDRAAKPIYSIEHLQNLYNRLQHIKNDDDQNRDTMVEVIRQITEALIWGEQNGHDHNFFDFFCEKNILADFVSVLGVPKEKKSVKVQLLQTLSMLVQNIRRDTSLYYLFSRNYVNQLIATQFDWNDEEILGYYISFLKSLALRLNAETIKFFFNERAEQFPLYIESVRFFGHRDHMVRTAVRTTTLQVYSVQDTAMQRFVLDRSSRTYFVHLACHLRELWLRLDQAAARAAVSCSSEQATAALQEANEQQQDLLMYIADVLGLEIAPLSEALAETLLTHAMLPALLGSLLHAAGQAPSGTGAAPDGIHSAVAAAGTGDATGSTGPACLLSPATALFVLNQVFDTCSRSRALLEPLAAALLRPRVPVELLRRCLHAPPPPPTYRATNADVSGPASQEVGIAANRGEATGAWDPGGGSSSSSWALASADGEPADDTEVSVRSHLLACLSGPTDACVLLVAGILSVCLACQKVLPEALLAEAGILPSQARAEAGETAGSPNTPTADAAADAHASASDSRRDEPPEPLPPPCVGEGGVADANLAGHSLEVLLLVVRALERHTSLRVVVVQALVQLAVDLSGEMSARCRARWRQTLLAAAKRAVQSAARHVRTYVHGESFLDVFAEEWDLHSRPLLGIREASSSIRCLLPVGSSGTSAGAGLPGSAPAEWALPTSHSERQHAAKAIRCLLTIRRLHLEVSPAVGKSSVQPVGTPPVDILVRGVPVAGASKDLNCYPLQVAEEGADGYSEGRSLELGRQDRIVCGVVTPEGRHTRYLVLHPFLLLLVQPDLECPGLAVVRTLAPVRQVDSQIDRTDPRTLRLGIRLARGAACPSEASPCDPAGADHFRLPAEEHRGGSLFMLTLSFEDVKRCHCADHHLRRRRADVREQLRERAEAFIEGLCL